MNELINIKAVWLKVVSWWKVNLLTVILCVVFYGIGGAVSTKMIVDDCRFMGSFRDGAQAYNCQARVR